MSGDVSKLKEILSRSKAILNKTEEEYGRTGSKVTESFDRNTSYEEKEIPNLTENYINKMSDNVNSVAPKNGQYRNMEKSKLPDFIKQAMIDNPIEIPETPFHTFELDDVSEIVSENKVVKQKPKTLTESTTTNVGVSEGTIRKIIKEEIQSIVRDVIEEYLDKSLVTEDIQIKIGSTIFSGNLKPLPSKKR
jgi:phenylalanyl-tRNA synthetase alpha subunit